MKMIKYSLFLCAMMAFANTAVANTTTIVVDFEDSATREEVSAVERELGVDLTPNSIMYHKTKIARLAVDTTQADVLIDKLEELGVVENVEREVFYRISLDNSSLHTSDYYPRSEFDFPDFVSTSGGFPNDPMYQEGKQWNMEMLGIENAWKVSDGEGVIVAVLDTGISTGDGKYPRVPDLRQTCMVKGYNFIDDDTDAYDWHGHGTHVGGTIAQSTNNGLGVVGVAPEACLMPVKVLSDEGYGSTTDIAEAIIWATDMGAHVINMSLGGGGYSQVMADAVKYAADNGVFVACAAGNSGRGVVEYPAALEGCHAVSSVGKDGELAFYSSYGTNGGGIFIAAPGGDQKKHGPEGGIFQDTIVAGKPNQHGFFPFQGTSMATPHVAGVAALIISSFDDEYTLEDVEDAMIGGATPKGEKGKYGNGILNASASLSGKTAPSSNNGFVSVLGAIALLLSVVMIYRSR